nr:ABC transporter A family member 8-like [Lolium perenne]
MENIYNNMGVCPQNDMLWEMLTGREHLQFYGRLKNLNGSSLDLAVEESLRSVNLLHGGAPDKQVRTYSGGMQRRLSVAISLIGDAKVVYMDEPSTGLDPASRKSLWCAVKQAKQDRAIILTSNLQHISNRSLIARYGGYYVLSANNHDIVGVRTSGSEIGAGTLATRKEGVPFVWNAETRAAEARGEDCRRVQGHGKFEEESGSPSMGPR